MDFLRRTAPALVAVIGLLAAGCQVPQANMQNLRELHRPDGRANRQAKVKSGVAYQLERLFDLSGFGLDNGLDGTAQQVKDADRAALEQLGELLDAGDELSVVAATAIAAELRFVNRLEDVAIVYYPGVRFFSSMIQSEFFQGIIGDKQLGDTQSTITVPVLDRL